VSAEEHTPDPAVLEAVEQVRDRFGAAGLRDMIEFAERELVATEEALEVLRRSVSEGAPEG
jgi:hypothetical protein